MKKISDFYRLCRAIPFKISIFFIRGKKSPLFRAFLTKGKLVIFRKVTQISRNHGFIGLFS